MSQNKSGAQVRLSGLAALGPIHPTISNRALVDGAFELIARKNAILDLENHLRGEHFPYNFEEDSLQKRLLSYFQRELGLEGGDELLRDADARRKEVLGAVAREGKLGLHPANREIAKLVQDFSDFELSLLYKVISAKSPSKELMSREILNLIASKIRLGRGEDLIRYIAEQWKCRRAREKKTGGAAGDIFNPNRLVAAILWTYPNVPLWMMPSAAAANIVSRYTEKTLSNDSYNDMVKKDALPRVESSVLVRFFEVDRRDPECLILRKEVEAVSGISTQHLQRGAPRKTGKRKA